MKTTIKFEDYEALVSNIIKCFKKECYEILRSHKEFTEKYDKMFSIEARPSALIFVEDEILSQNKKDKDGKRIGWKEPMFSKKDIINTYNKEIYERQNTPAKAYCSYIFDDEGNAVIKELRIQLNYDFLNATVLSNLYRITEYYDVVIKSWAQHECGHILDYIISFDGLSKKVIDKEENEIIKARKAYSKWWKDNRDKNGNLTPELETQRLKMYFEIPCEAKADMLGGVDREKVIAYTLKNKNRRVVTVMKSKTVKMK